MRQQMMAIGPVGRREQLPALKKSRADYELWLQRARRTIAKIAQAPRRWSWLDIPPR